MNSVLRGEVWAVDFEPQTHRQEPGKKERPALVIQTNALNKAGHPTTIVSSRHQQGGITLTRRSLSVAGAYSKNRRFEIRHRTSHRPDSRDFKRPISFSILHIGSQSFEKGRGSAAAPDRPLTAGRLKKRRVSRQAPLTTAADLLGAIDGLRTAAASAYRPLRRNVHRPLRRCLDRHRIQLVNHPVLHHETDALHQADVVDGVAGHRHHIRDLARRHRA